MQQVDSHLSRRVLNTGSNGMASIIGVNGHSYPHPFSPSMSSLVCVCVCGGGGAAGVLEG